MDSRQKNTLDLSDGKSKQSSMDEMAWKVVDTKLLPDKSKFTKEVARCWNEASFSTKFEQFHPNWQKVLLAFARKVARIEV